MGAIHFGMFVMGTRSGSYADILDQIERAEELGFDAVLLAERHFRHGDLLYPSPFNMAAAVAARTETIRIGTAARILPLDHPVHVAEDAATVDVLSGGRLEFGATRGSLDAYCHRVFQSPLEESRGRFEEALDVIVGAWTEERFSYQGAHYRIPEVSVFPKPLQKPHPPISIVAVAPESLDYAAGRGYSAFIGAVRPIPELRETFGRYQGGLRERPAQDGRTGLHVNRFIYVSESDAAARREIEGPFMTFIRERAPDLKDTLAKRYGAPESFSFDRFLEDFCLFGSPATVAARIEELRERVGLEHLLVTLNYITLDHALCLRSMELFAAEVMPAFTP